MFKSWKLIRKDSNFPNIPLAKKQYLEIRFCGNCPRGFSWGLGGMMDGHGKWEDTRKNVNIKFFTISSAQVSISNFLFWACTLLLFLTPMSLGSDIVSYKRDGWINSKLFQFFGKHPLNVKTFQFCFILKKCGLFFENFIPKMNKRWKILSSKIVAILLFCFVLFFDPVGRLK